MNDSAGFWPDPLLRPAAYWAPDRLTDIRDWHGHLPFAFWLMDVMRPQVLVELGTYKGDSYCGFCQALRILSSSTVCCAVDTWVGDDHVGQYGPDVYEALRAYHDTRYADFSRLLRTTFDDAVSQFADGTIDVLHIDGAHAYEAVRHDFDTWLSKLSPHGVMLIHDIAVHEPGFGVWRLWQEESARYPSFGFSHCHGLGILATGSRAPAAVAWMAALSDDERHRFRQAFAVLGRTVRLQSLLTATKGEFRRAKDEQRSLLESIERLESEVRRERTLRDAAVEERGRLREQLETQGLLHTRATESLVREFDTQLEGERVLREKATQTLMRELTAILSGEPSTNTKSLWRDVLEPLRGVYESGLRDRAALTALERELSVLRREIVARDRLVEETQGAMHRGQADLTTARTALADAAEEMRRLTDHGAASRAQRLRQLSEVAREILVALHAFAASETWRLARLLQRVKFRPTGNPLSEIQRSAKGLMERNALATEVDSAAWRALVLILSRGSRELRASKTVWLAKTLVQVSWIARGRCPGPGALEALGECVAKLEALAETGLTAAVPPGTEVGPRQDPAAEKAADDRYRQYYEGVLARRTSVRAPRYFVPFEIMAPLRDPQVRIIAFYLPQYHPIPENDEYWERGFTEWTNVTRAVPQFLGHYQPQLPIDVGFYDLRLADVLRRQAEIAYNYGVYGFCFHHYWFGGKHVMRTPIELLRSRPDVHIPFCLNWANENWTRRWDGLDDEVLLRQQHSPSDDLAFIADTVQYMKDQRYIRIGGRPVLMVYRPALLPDPLATAQRWRQYCRDHGVGDPYLIAGHAFDPIDPRVIGFDAAVEYAPNNMPLPDARETVVMLNEGFSGKIAPYESAVELGEGFAAPDYPTFRSVCPGWDNEPRRPGRGTILLGSTPRLYERWLEGAALWTIDRRDPGDRFLFVNAWNEWAEGAHLEPDRRYGYAYLRSTYNVLKGLELVEDIAKPMRDGGAGNRIGVICHLYYAELWDELKLVLASLDEPFSLYVTIPRGARDGAAAVVAIKDEYPEAHVFRVENRGRDVWPFIQVLNVIGVRRHDYLLKIHSKRSPHRQDGEEMRRGLLRGLAGSRERSRSVVRLFDDNPRVGLVAPGDYLETVEDHWGSNRERVVDLAARLGRRECGKHRFVVGTMFWCRSRAMGPLLRLELSRADFPVEEGQLDGEVHHAVERVVGMVVENAGYEVAAL